MAELVTTMQGTHYDELIGGTAVPVMTKNVTLKGVTAAYTRGTLLSFNREKLIVKNAEDTVDAHEEELRDVGIYLTSIQ